MSQVATPQNQRLTAEDLFQRNDRDERKELVAGELLSRSPASAEQGVIALRISAWLLRFVEQHQLGVVCAAGTGFLIHSDPDTVRAPDAAFISRERLGEGRPPKKFW